MTFVENILRIYGSNGKRWLDNLPGLVDSAIIKFCLTQITPVLDLSYNYVASCFQKGKPCILKIGIDEKSIRKEAAALRCFDGVGAVRLLAEDNGMLLLEIAIPGTTLKTCFPEKDEESISSACKVMQKLHKALYQNGMFPHIKDWLSLSDKNWKIPLRYLQKARDLRDYLLLTTCSEVLLHGDLHHDNILLSSGDYVAVDPKGVVGDPSFEVTTFICNPIPDLLNQLNFCDIVKRSISIFAETLDIQEQRIINWCFVKAVLSWIWALDDNMDTKYWEKMTKIFEEYV